MSRNRFSLVALAVAALTPIGVVGFLSPNHASATEQQGHADHYATLLRAISLRSPAAVDSAIAEGCDPNYMPPAPGYRISRPLCIAAMNGDTRIVRLLLQRGAAIEVGDGLNGTPLDAAAERNRVEVVKVLLEAGAEVNDSHSGSSALWCATQQGAVETVAVLLAKGANPNTSSGISRTPEKVYRVIDMATQNHNDRIVALLERYGAKPPTGDRLPPWGIYHDWPGGEQGDK